MHRRTNWRGCGRVGTQNLKLLVVLFVEVSFESTGGLNVTCQKGENSIALEHSSRKQWPKNFVLTWGI